MTAHGDSSVPLSTRAPAGRAAGTATVTTALILTLALQSAVPPFATDMYTPAFPRVTAGLDTSASLVGLTLTTFFLGMALGQLLGGPSSDQRGPAEFWVLVPATPTTHLVNDFNALSCAFPVDADLLPSAADVRTCDQGMLRRSPTLTPNCTVSVRSAPQLTAPWATRTR
jgi:MFS family permease